MSKLNVLLLPAMLALTLSAHAPLHAQTQGLQSPEVRPASQAYRVTPEGALRRELARGVYQAAYSPLTNSLYVASAEAITNVKGGVIYQLDPVTLETTGLFHTDEKNFGMAINPAGDTLYVTNSLGGAVSKIDVKTGKVLARLVFEERSDDGSAYGPREVLYHAPTDTLYVGGVGDPGRIWVIDGDTFTIRTSIGNAGKWVTGLLLDEEGKRLFSANGDGEVLVIDTQSHSIQHRWKPAGTEPALLLNLAFDPVGKRLFVTDNSQLKTVLVLDSDTGKLRERLPVGDSLDVLYQPERNAIYVSHREQGKVSILDATSYQVNAQYSLPPNPNSLALLPDGKTLFVTVKTPFAPDYSASGVGSIVRIDLP